MKALNRVRVVFTRKGTRPSALIVNVHDTLDRAISTSNHQEGTYDDEEHAPPDQKHPALTLLRLVLALGPVVVQPHAAHGLDAHDGAEKGTDERDERVEDGNRASNDVCNESDPEGAAEPGRPVNWGVGV